MTETATAADERTIYQRMVAVIDALPAIGKTQRNEQQNFMFRGHDDVLNALNPLLSEHGVFVVPTVTERIYAQRTTSKGGIMHEVNLRVEFTFYGASGDSFTGSTWGEGTDMGDKATSKALTMAFKYMIAQAFAVSTAEAGDPDSTTAEDTSVPLATDEQVEELRVSLASEGIADETIEGNFAKVRNAEGKLPLDYVQRNLANSRERIASGVKPKQAAEAEPAAAEA